MGLFAMKASLLAAAMLGAAALSLSCGVAFGTGLGGGGEWTREVAIGLPVNGLDTSDIPAQRRVFSVRKDWIDFWKAHSQSPAPLVDFRRWQIVALFLGPKPNPGYGVRIERAEQSSTGVRASYSESVPAPGMMYAQVITYPYDIVSVPYRGAVKGTVKFDRGEPRAPEKPGPSQSVEARVLDTAGLAMPREARYLAFTDEKAWQEFWSGRGASSPPAADFAREIIVGVALPTGGIEAQFVAAEAHGAATRVKMMRVPKGTGRNWLLIAVPRADRVDLGWVESQL